MASYVLNAPESSAGTAAAIDAVLSRRMAFVTGKGGVGKSTVPAALALAADARGRRTMMCDLAGIDPDAALAEWMTRNIGRAGEAVLAHSETFRYFVAAAPGARELLTIGKAWDLTRPRRGRPKDRLVIVDAPATGHAIALLQAPRTYTRLDRVGPIGAQAGEIRAFLADPSRSAIVLVCTPAELPVTETLGLAEAVEDATGRPADVVIANEVLADRFSADEVERLEAAVDSVPRLRATVRPALTSWRRAHEQEAQLRRLAAGLAVPIVELPFLFVPALGRQELRTLAAHLASGSDVALSS
ncbi:MAG TPA: ArsA-related P-loop ATPase [Solirubrobacteraceae bacterium]|nr:ArsA-related P-loop ATPase [Solirubrobacteraceae bacterium]